MACEPDSIRLTCCWEETAGGDLGSNVEEKRGMYGPKKAFAVAADGGASLPVSMAYPPDSIVETLQLS